MNSERPLIEPTWEELTAAYRNTSAHNDDLFSRLTQLTWSEPLTARHRRYIEDHNLGFGDAAFHAMWLRLLDAAVDKFGRPKLLEIGVFKGQVISLWSLIGKALGVPLAISAITPMVGKPKPANSLGARLRRYIDRGYKEDLQNANFYDDDDYERAIRSLFDEFGLCFNEVSLLRGLSSDPEIIERLNGQTFDVVYVDGDHSYEGALHDFRTFAPRVAPGGWLVADDAGCALPGTLAWKGHPSVSRAAELLPSLGFFNVLNVGHNRVYQRQ